MRVDLVVEEAGCESCAKRVREALEPLAQVERVEIDEAADVAAVTLVGSPPQDAVAVALADASAGAGHTYRIRPGSWTVE